MTQSSFNNGSFQHLSAFNQSLPSQSTSDVFNINSSLPTHYGSSPNLAIPQQNSCNQPLASACCNISCPLDVNDPNLQLQVEQIIASLSEQKRPVLRRQVITVPAQCQGRVACITRRLPTPAPDIIERITVIKPPRDVVDLCIEKPTQPEPCFQSREICGKQRKPLIHPRVVEVPPRNNPCRTSPCQQQQQQFAPSASYAAPTFSAPPTQYSQPQYAPQQQQYAPQQYAQQQYTPQQYMPQRQYVPQQYVQQPQQYQSYAQQYFQQQQQQQQQQQSQYPFSHRF